MKARSPANMVIVVEAASACWVAMTSRPIDHLLNYCQQESQQQQLHELFGFELENFETNNTNSYVEILGDSHLLLFCTGRTLVTARMHLP